MTDSEHDALVNKVKTMDALTTALARAESLEADRRRLDNWKHWIAELYTSPDDNGVCIGSELTVESDLSCVDGPTRTIRESIDEVMKRTSGAETRLGHAEHERQTALKQLRELEQTADKKLVALETRNRQLVQAMGEAVRALEAIVDEYNNPSDLAYYEACGKGQVAFEITAGDVVKCLKTLVLLKAELGKK